MLFFVVILFFDLFIVFFGFIMEFIRVGCCRVVFVGVVEV